NRQIRTIFGSNGDHQGPRGRNAAHGVLGLSVAIADAAQHDRKPSGGSLMTLRAPHREAHPPAFATPQRELDDALGIGCPHGPISMGENGSCERTFGIAAHPNDKSIAPGDVLTASGQTQRQRQPPRKEDPAALSLAFGSIRAHQAHEYSSL